MSHTSDGYPLDENGVQVYATTNVTEWPVAVYKYTELIKSQYAFEQQGQNYIPQIILGAGDENGNSKGYFFKDETSLRLRYVSSQQKNVDINFSDEGFVDAMHRRLEWIDIDSDNGEIWYGIEGNNSLDRMTFRQTTNGFIYTWPDGFQCEVNLH